MVQSCLGIEGGGLGRLCSSDMWVEMRSLGQFSSLVGSMLHTSKTEPPFQY